MLGYAHLKDIQTPHQPEEAAKLYLKAVKAYPQEACVYNNLANHYFQLGMFRQAIAMLERAIQLQPKEIKYRNNIAILLVQMGMPQEAFTHLLAVHNEAAAHYNLGFIMARCKQREQASLQFSLALQVNPSMTAARQWLDRLNGRAVSMNPSAAPVMGQMQGPPNYRLEEPRLAVQRRPRPVLYPLPPTGR